MLRWILGLLSLMSDADAASYPMPSPVNQTGHIIFDVTGY